MKIANIEIPDRLIIIAVSLMSFCLGVAVGVKATLSNLANKVEKAHQLHPSTNDNQGSQGDRDFRKSVYEMFIGPFPLIPDNRNNPPATHQTRRGVTVPNQNKSSDP